MKFKDLLSDFTRLHILHTMLRSMRCRLLFVEHGLSSDEGVRWWQDRLTPAWKSIRDRSR